MSELEIGPRNASCAKSSCYRNTTTENPSSHHLPDKETKKKKAKEMTKEREKIENLDWESSKNISTFNLHQFKSLGGTFIFRLLSSVFIQVNLYSNWCFFGDNLLN